LIGPDGIIAMTDTQFVKMQFDRKLGSAEYWQTKGQIAKTFISTERGFVSLFACNPEERLCSKHP
jgi:hypothetical protein